MALPVAWLEGIEAAALAGFAVLAFTRANMHIRVLFTLVMCVSAATAVATGTEPAFVRGFERAQVFGAFLAAVLLLRATAEASPRLDSLRRGMGGLGADARVNWMLYGSQALGAVLNIGAMSILAPVVSRDASERERRALAASSARGVGAAVMWSPFFAAIAFTSQLVPQVAIWQVMLIGAGLTVIGLALSHALFTPHLDGAGFRASVAQLRPLALPMGVVIAGVVGASTFLHLSALQSVALVVPAFCGVYLMLLGRPRSRVVVARAFASFGRLADELLIMVGSTILATVVSAQPAVHALGASLHPGLLAGPVIMAMLVVVLVALGQAGLHPMIGAGIVVPVLAAAPFGISPDVLVAAAVFAWGLSSSISLWTLPVVAASTHFEVPVRDLLSRASLRYAALYGAVGILYLGAVNAMLGAA